MISFAGPLSKDRRLKSPPRQLLESVPSSFEIRNRLPPPPPASFASVSKRCKTIPDFPDAKASRPITGGSAKLNPLRSFSNSCSDEIVQRNIGIPACAFLVSELGSFFDISLCSDETTVFIDRRIWRNKIG